VAVVTIKASKINPMASCVCVRASSGDTQANQAPRFNTPSAENR